jgi:hypothetical protein
VTSSRRPRIKHWVLHLGSANHPMPSFLDEDGAVFGYQVMMVKKLDPTPYLRSGTVPVSIFATLCRGGTDADIIRQALQRIARAGDRGPR